MTDQSPQSNHDELDAEEVAEEIGDLFGAKGGEEAKTLQPDAPPSEDDEASPPTR